MYFLIFLLKFKELYGIIISRGDVMIKINSCEAITASPESDRLVLNSRFMQLSFILDGGVYVNKEYMTVAQGFFVNSSTNVKLVPDKSSNCSICNFLLDGDVSEKLLHERSLSSDEFVKFTLSDTPACLDFIRILSKYDFSQANDAFCQAAAKLLLSFIKSENTSNYKPIYSNPYVDRAVRYINDNIASELRVETIASIIGIDRMYMRNLFFEHLGMSTMDYIMQTRISRAKELLSNEKLSITSVANSVGYRDVLAFSKVFKKYVGASPTEFRTGAKKVQARKKEDVPIFIL